MVAEQARRGGIGRRLIATAEDWIASIGATYMHSQHGGRLASTSLWDTPNLPRSFAS
jgi:GNAT superfamily N-acetyltransferase